MRFAPLLVLALAACGDNYLVPDARHADAAADAPVDGPFNPPTLFDTGLCVDQACTQISSDVHTYTPQWALWSDAATKRRWYYLPPNTKIDTTDMDHWQFPVGTKFWKEFTSTDGSGNPVRVETRLEQRIGSGDTAADWFYVAYEWNAANDDTMAVPMGVMNADGTMHDIPSRVDCKSCHENLQPTRVLGFGALQLDTAVAAGGDTNLADLVAAGTLTQNPTGSGAPYFPPQATGDTLAALGYLHANCGHCHNPTSAYYASQTTMSFRLEVATIGDTAMTPTYLSAVGHVTNTAVNGHDIIIDPGLPDMSVLIDRFEANPTASNYMMIHMPQLGSEVMDPTADTTLRAWITSITP